MSESNYQRVDSKRELEVPIENKKIIHQEYKGDEVECSTLNGIIEFLKDDSKILKFNSDDVRKIDFDKINETQKQNIRDVLYVRAKKILKVQDDQIKKGVLCLFIYFKSVVFWRLIFHLSYLILMITGMYYYFHCGIEWLRISSYSPIIYIIFYFVTFHSERDVLFTTISTLLVDDENVRFISCFLVMIPILLTEKKEINTSIIKLRGEIISEDDNIEKNKLLRNESVNMEFIFRYSKSESNQIISYLLSEYFKYLNKNVNIYHIY